MSTYEENQTTAEMGQKCNQQSKTQEVQLCLHKENGHFCFGALNATVQDKNDLGNGTEIQSVDSQDYQSCDMGTQSGWMSGSSWNNVPPSAESIPLASQYVDQWYKAGFRTLEHSINKATDREYHREIKNMDLEFREKQWEQEDNRD